MIQRLRPLAVCLTKWNCEEHPRYASPENNHK